MKYADNQPCKECQKCLEYQRVQRCEGCEARTLRCYIRWNAVVDVFILSMIVYLVVKLAKLGALI